MLETADRRLLLDCGPGTVRSLARVDAEWAAITDVWVSHFHTDHVGDLPGLLFSLKWGLLPERRTAPLTIWGPPGIRVVLGGFAAAAGGPEFDLGFELRVREVRPGTGHALADDLELRALKTPHTDESLALRIEGPGWSMAYSGDTGPAVALGEFARGVDLFVCECSLPDDLAGEIHVSPSAVARFASVAEPGMLLVTHVYPQFRAAADVLGLIRAAGWTGPASLAREGWTTSLGRGRGPQGSGSR